MSVAMIGVPASSASLAACAASRSATRSLTLRDSFSRRGIALSTVSRSARISSVWMVRDVAARVDLAVDVGDVLVAEDAGDLADRGGLADVREELVAQALALRGAADDAGDVDELDRRGQQLLRAEDLRELRQPVVGHADDADVGLDRRERVVRREHVVLGQRVEEGRLARVGETDDADGESHGRGVYGGAAARHEKPGESPAKARDVTGGRASGRPRNASWCSGAVEGPDPCAVGRRSSRGRSRSRCTAGSA